MTRNRPSDVVDIRHGDALDVLRSIPAESPQETYRPPVRPLGVDAVSFTAACPECGDDTEWFERRVDTSVFILVTCPCRKRHKTAA